MQATRRGFVTGLAAPLILGAQNKSGSKNPVVGTGSHTYEVIHDWGELPANIAWGNTHGVVEDSQGQIYVHHTVNKASQSADTMVVFDNKGKFVRSWGKEFRGVAHGLSIRKEGPTEFLYLSVNAANAKLDPQPTMSAVIIKATTKGEIVWKIQGPPDVAEYRPGADGQPKRYNPTNLAVAPNGDVYVGDGYGSSYVNQYDSKGNYIRTFGGRGSEAGKLAEPHGIWMDMRSKTPVLTVADRANARIQRFTLDGKHIDFVQNVTKPCHFDEHKGDVVIPDLQGKVELAGMPQADFIFFTKGANGDAANYASLRKASTVIVSAPPEAKRSFGEIDVELAGGGLLFTMAGRRFYVSGEQASVPVQKVDAAFICLSAACARDAAATIRSVDARVIFPYRFGRRDLRGLKGSPQSEVRLRHWY